MTKIHPTAAILAAMPGTQQEIRLKTKTAVASTSRWVTYMRENGLCHVGAWKRSANFGPNMAVLHAGAGADVSCPSKQDPAKPARLHNAGTIRTVRLDGAQHRCSTKVLTPTRCALTAALFGHGPA